MSESRRNAGRWAISVALASSLLLSNVLPVLAAPGDVNSTNDGHDIAGGTYYNTPGDKTTFVNSAGTGLYLSPGSTVTGHEVDAGTLQPNGNGGWVHFNAPGQVVRLDGNVDVSGFINNGTLGNGGRVTVDSAFLYQNGQIFANGANAGQVLFNVGSVTMGPNAGIQAQGNTGTYGTDGNVNIKATGAVNINQGAIVDASGNFVGSYNTNVINIQGGLVNLDGIVMANGLNPGQAGGTAHVEATGNTAALNGVALANASDTIFSAAEKTNLLALDSQLRNQLDGSVQIGSTGHVAADGAVGAGDNNPVDGGNGGIASIKAAKDVLNNGHVSADGGSGFVGNNPTNGGSGGLVAITAGGKVSNDGRLSANGGNGGTNPDVAVGAVSRFYKGQELFKDQNGAYVLKSTDAQGNVCYTDEWGTPIAVNPADLTEAYVQHSIGQDGGNGGNGGTVDIHYGTTITNNGTIEVIGGDGGAGQSAVANAREPEYPAQVAQGGNGGNGGNGGFVSLTGGVGAQLPSDSTLANINVNGGSGAQGGSADTLNECGCEIPGANGGCGAPGQIVYSVDKKPPFTPPTTPLFPPYPKEYPRVGYHPPTNSNVLSYNRSIFLARSPMPIIQKRKPAPKVMFTQTVPQPVVPAPKAPPQKKKTVRGYW